MNTAEYAQPLYSVHDGPGTAVRPRKSGADDDPLADTDARGRPVAADRRLAGRAAQTGSTGPQRRVAGRNRAEPTTGSGPRVRPGGSGAVAEPADPAWTDPVPADRAIANAGQRGSADQLDRAVGGDDAPEIQVLDRQLRSRGKPPEGGAPKARKQPASGKSRPRAGRHGARKVLILTGLVIVAVVIVASYVVFKPQASHAVSTPATLGTYSRQQANAPARALKQRIVAAGDVKNVVAAVYERTTGTSTGSQIVVFIGGNLAGNASASSLISAFMTRLHGAFATSAGKLGGQAACAPGSNGGPAECTWADNDTFGVVVSAALTSAGLADEMRQMRPLIEHAVK